MRIASMKRFGMKELLDRLKNVATTSNQKFKQGYRKIKILTMLWEYKIYLK